MQQLDSTTINGSDSVQCRQPADFWQGKRVIVTGGAGFLGTYMNYLLADTRKAQAVLG